MTGMLARIENPDGVFPEIDWINSRVRILGESYGVACRSVEDLIKDGSMIVVEAAELDQGETKEIRI